LMPAAASSAMGTALQNFVKSPADIDKVMQDIEDAAVSSY
jgi:hypothetical protein